jgi:hypothetical protein
MNPTTMLQIFVAFMKSFELKLVRLPFPEADVCVLPYPQILHTLSSSIFASYRLIKNAQAKNSSKLVEFEFGVNQPRDVH